MRYAHRQIQTIILDLDGPLLDCKRRHYACYSHILLQHGYRPISMDDYWEMKRRRLSQQQQLAASGAESIQREFRESWLSLIEQWSFLKLDQLQPGATEALQQWRTEGKRLVLATLRQNKPGLLQQLAWFGLDALFDHVLVCNHSEGAKGKVAEVSLITPKVAPESSLWIGDTEVDAEAAKYLGCLVWLVTCGIREESYLRSLSPDFISSSLASTRLEQVHL